MIEATNSEHTELYKKYRPTKFNQVFGNKEVIKSLTKAVKTYKVPHALMFVGDSGCCKTTLARIIRTKLHCHTGDYREINASDKRGIQMIRGIGDSIGAVPMFGKTRVWVIDEAQGMTSAAQNALLKFLEDPPKHAYLILCTTDPSKIIKTIHSRCTQFQVGPLSNTDLGELLTSVCKKEKVSPPSKKVLSRIYDVSENAPRKALVILEQIYKLDSEQEMIDAVQKTESRQQAIDLVRKLIQPKPKWVQIKELVKVMDDDPEKTRRIMLGYASSVCLGGGPLSKRAAVLYEVFRDMFLNGRSDLIFACFSVCAGT